MEKTEFKILDTLSRDPGRETSISSLTRDIQKLHGSAYYSNTYKALTQMEEEGIVSLTKAGNSSLVALNFKNGRTIDALSEMELRKRRSLLTKREELQRLFDSIPDAALIGPTSLIDGERNIRLNRAELLFQLPEWASSEGATEALQEDMNELERKLNIRIDALTLDDKAFRSLLATRERNALKAMLSRQTALLAPDLFWSRIRNAWAHGIQIQFDQKEIDPARMSEQDLVYNLARFGYTEFGTQIGEGQEFGIEYLVTTLLLKRDARRILAIPVILAKSQANYALLLFLSRKYGVSSELFGLLRALAIHQDDQELQRALHFLEKDRVKEASVDIASIEEIMRTYSAIPGT